MKRFVLAATTAACLAGMHSGANANATTSLSVQITATALDPTQSSPGFGPAFETSYATWSDSPAGPPYIVDQFLMPTLDLWPGQDPNGWGSAIGDGQTLSAQAFTNQATYFSVTGYTYGQFFLTAFTAGTITIDTDIVASNATSGGSVEVCFMSDCSTVSSGSHVFSYAYSNDTDLYVFPEVDITATAFSSGVPEPGEAAMLLAGVGLLALRRRRGATRATCDAG